MIPASELAEMRATARATLGSVCNPITNEWVRDDRGNLELVWVTGPDMVCQLGSVSADEEGELVGLIGTVNAYHVLIPQDAEVSTADKLLVTTEGESTLYEVVGSTGRMTYMPLQRLIVKDTPDAA